MPAALNLVTKASESDPSFVKRVAARKDLLKSVRRGGEVGRTGAACKVGVAVGVYNYLSPNGDVGGIDQGCAGGIEFRQPVLASVIKRARSEGEFAREAVAGHVRIAGSVHRYRVRWERERMGRIHQRRACRV